MNTLLVAFAICAARTTKISGITASFSRIRVFTARYAPKTVRRLLFYKVSSFLSIILRAVSIPYGVYQINTLNIIADLITEKYTNLIILKLTSYINVKIRLIIKLYIINFFLILSIYYSYF